MKWKYDKPFRQYWVEDKGWTIDAVRVGKGVLYELRRDHFRRIGGFNKLKNAKLVAELIENG